MKNEKYVYAGLSVVAGLFLLLFSPYTTLLNDYYGYDTAIWNVIGKGIAEGKIPYKDLFDHKGPILLFIYAIAWLFERHRLVMFLLQWGAFTITIYYLYKTVRLFVEIKKTFICVGVFLFLFCGTISEGAMSEEWCLPFITVSVFYCLRFLKTDERRSKVPIRYGLLLGICFGVIAMIRLNNAAPVCGIVLALCLLQFIKKEYSNILVNAGAFIMGACIVIFPIAVWFYLKDALYYLWWGAFQFNFEYAIHAPDVRTTWEMVRPWIMSIPIIAYISLCIMSVKVNRIEEDKFLVGMMGCISVIALMFGGSYFHYYTIILPIHVLLVCIILNDYADKSRIRKILYVGVLSCFLISYTWQSVRNAGKSMLFNFAGWYDGQHEQIRDFTEQIPTEDWDSVWGNGEGFSKTYCISGITPCFPYFDNSRIHFKVSPTMEAETWKMLEEKPPKWIVLGEIERLPSERIITCIQQKYEVVDILNGERHLELYRLK